MYYYRSAAGAGFRLGFRVVLFRVVLFRVALFWVVLFRVVSGFRVAPDNEGAKGVEDHVVLRAVAGHIG